jgi:hypothetical protein
MADKQFIGNCKKLSTWATKVGLHKDKCVFDERGWLNIVVVHNSDNLDKKAYAYIDEWKPESVERSEERTEAERQSRQPNDPINTLPF